MSDHVLLVEQLKGYLNVNKLLPKFSGPFRVKEVNENGLTYIIENQFATKRAHYDQLRFYKMPPRYLRNCERYQHVCNDLPILQEAVHPPIAHGSGGGVDPSEPNESLFSSSDEDFESNRPPRSSKTNQGTAACDCAGCQYEENYERFLTRMEAPSPGLMPGCEPVQPESFNDPSNEDNLGFSIGMSGSTAPEDADAGFINLINTRFANNDFSEIASSGMAQAVDWELEPEDIASFNCDLESDNGNSEDIMLNNMEPTNDCLQMTLRASNVNPRSENLVAVPEELENGVIPGDCLENSNSTASINGIVPLLNSGGSATNLSQRWSLVEEPLLEFSGFGEEHIVQNCLLGTIRPVVRRSLVSVSPEDDAVFPVEQGAMGPQLQTVSDATVPSNSSTRPYTRSQGSVAEFPNVQQRIIEYERQNKYTLFYESML